MLAKFVFHVLGVVVVEHLLTNASNAAVDQLDGVKLELLA